MFLAILLLVPFTFCQTDSLEMIQTSEEGREMLNTLFIESQLLGPNLDSATVKSIIHRTYNNLKKRSANSHLFVKQYKAECAADKKALNANVQESREKEYVVHRHLEAANREQKRKALFIERTREEYDNYDRIYSFAKYARAGWADFYATSKKSMDRLESVLGHIGLTIRGVRAARKAAKKAAGKGKPAFIELPEDYATNLVQVKADFENNYSDEFKHVVVNMLEIMTDVAAVSKKSVRVSLRRLLETLSEKVRSRIELLEEENETQSSLFDNLQKALHASVARTRKSLDILQKSQVALERKAAGISASIKRSKNHTDRAERIFGLRSKECRQSKHVHKYLSVKRSKLFSVLSILSDLVNERFPALKQAIKTKPKERVVGVAKGPLKVKQPKIHRKYASSGK